MQTMLKRILKLIKICQIVVKNLKTENNVMFYLHFKYIFFAKNLVNIKINSNLAVQIL